MLIKCPECELQASDKAMSCPHCGYPFQPNISVSRPRKTNKRRRLPNGFGQISEIKNRNLRNPFRAMVSVGKTPTGRPICEMLKPNAYFATYNDAYEALMNYNKDPYTVAKSTTMQELYEIWLERYSKTVKSNRAITSAWEYCGEIRNIRVSEFRIRHIKTCVENGTIEIYGEKRSPSENVKNRIKSMFNMMLDYAIEYELTDRNYAREFNMKTEHVTRKYDTEKAHIPFTQEELDILWQNSGTSLIVDMMLIQCYSGWRPRELTSLKLENIDLENWSFTGGMKTEAGINRVVPIHSKIRPIVERKYKEANVLGSKNLFYTVDDNHKRKNMDYDKYRARFIEVRDALGLDPKHRPHDPRVTFVTLAKKYNVDEYAIKYMAGHAINDITEKVYTTREFSWLQTEIEKIR